MHEYYTASRTGYEKLGWVSKRLDPDPARSEHLLQALPAKWAFINQPDRILNFHFTILGQAAVSPNRIRFHIGTVSMPVWNRRSGLGLQNPAIRPIRQGPGPPKRKRFVR